MGTVRYVRPKLYPAQFEAIFCDERWSWIEASTKSGKTHGCIVWLHEQAALHGGPGKNFWWVAPVYPQAAIAFRRLCRALPDRTFRSNKSELTVELANGSVIWFKSGDHPDNLYGEDVYAAVIDEASRVKFDSFVAVRSTLTATRGPIRIIGNVKGRRNWAYRGCRRAESGLKGHHYARLTAYDAIKGGVIDSEEVEQAKRELPESEFRQLYLALPPEEGDSFFCTERISIVDSAPDYLRKARGWDFASTEPSKKNADPDWTAGVLLGHTEDQTYILDVVRKRVAPDGVLKAVTASAISDGRNTDIVIEEERGAAGKNMVESIRQNLSLVSGTGKVVPSAVSGDKTTRAFGFATRVNGRKVSLVQGHWNDLFLAELDEFPPDSGHDDQVDAAAHGFNHLSPKSGFKLRSLS